MCISIEVLVHVIFYTYKCIVLLLIYFNHVFSYLLAYVAAFSSFNLSMFSCLKLKYINVFLSSENMFISI